MDTKIRILAAEAVQDTLSSIIQSERMEVFYLSANELYPVSRISYLCPDIVILQRFSTHYDALNIMISYAEIFRNSFPCFIILCSSAGYEQKKELFDGGASAVLVQPWSAEQLESAIKKTYTANHRKKQSYYHNSLAAIHKIHDETANYDLDTQVDRILQWLGFSPSLSGYLLLKNAVMLAAQDQESMYSITRRIYPVIAEQFDTTPSTVERRIHELIDTVWNNSPDDNLEIYFGSTVSINRGKPANGEFIAAIADRIRLTTRTRSTIFLKNCL